MRILWVKMGGLWPPTSGGRLRSLHMLSRAVAAPSGHGAHDARPDEIRRAGGGDSRTAGSWCHSHSPRRSRAAASFARSRARGCHASRRSVEVACPGDARQVRRLLAERAVRRLRGRFSGRGAPTSRRPRRPAGFLRAQRRTRDLAATRESSDGCAQGAPRGRVAKDAPYEAAACAAADLTVAVSEDGPRRWPTLAPARAIASVPTGVDTPISRPADPRSPPRLVFTGSMDWYPNRRRDPLFRATDPAPHSRTRSQASRHRRRPQSERPQLARGRRRGIDGHGHGGRYPSLYRGRRVYVVPLRVGGGTRLKIFEALAMGKAVVSTTVGAEGLASRPGATFVLADDPRSSPAVVGAAPGPGAARPRTRRPALVEERYSWPQVAQTFEAHVQGGRVNATGDT